MLYVRVQKQTQNIPIKAKLILYIENKIREAFGFTGTPLRFIIRERKEDK